MMIKNMWSPSEQTATENVEEGAQQQFKEDCDINHIMARFEKTGVIAHAAKHQPDYGIANSQTLHEAVNLVARAESMFMDLSPEIRNKFNGKPTELLDFVQNPDNEQACKDLGLALSDEAQAIADARRAAAAASGTQAATEPGGVAPGGQEPATGEPPAPTPG